ncbi:uncharacterized protein LOC144441350 [Glandiceps talaboti]
MCDNELTTVPQGIYKLEKLRKLDIGYNHIKDIPVELFQMAELTELHVNSNHLIDIPRHNCLLDKLEMLNIESNHITDMPVEMFEMTELTFLNISNNQLTEIPQDIGKLKKLSTLNVGYNKIEEIPTGLYELEDLSELTISGNKLTAVHRDIRKLKNLLMLRLGRNPFKVMPSELFGLGGLCLLEMCDCQLTTIPQEIGTLKRLECLHLKGNKLKEITPELFKMRGLTDLRLSENQLTSIPQDICKLKNLQRLDVAANRITELPSGLFEITELNELCVRDTQITNIPSDIGKLKKLRKLNIATNQIQELPPDVCQLTDLTELYMHENQLPNLPEGIGKLEKLRELGISTNKLTEIPLGVFNMKKLRELYVYENEVYSIPEDIGNLSALQKLSLGSNPIKQIPSEIFGLNKLTELYMFGNQIAAIPKGIGNLRKLQKLCLHNNHIQGLPSELFELGKLTELDLNTNKLKVIPVNMAKLHELRLLNLRNNSIRELSHAVIRPLNKLQELLLDGNPLFDPPMVVCHRGVEAIRLYLRDRWTQGHADKRIRVKLMPQHVIEERHELLSGFWLRVPPNVLESTIEFEMELVGRRPALNDFEELETDVINMSPLQMGLPCVTLGYQLNSWDPSRHNVIVRSDDGIRWQELESTMRGECIMAEITCCSMYAVISRPLRKNIGITAKGGTYSSGNSLVSLEVPPGAVDGNANVTMEAHDLRSSPGSVNADISAGSVVMFQHDERTNTAVALNEAATIRLASPSSTSETGDKMSLRVLSSTDDGHDWTDVTESVASTLKVKNNTVSFSVEKLSGYGTACVPSSKINAVVKFFRDLFNSLRHRRHLAKVLLLQHEIQLCSLLVDIVRSRDINERIRMWKISGFKSYHDKDVAYSRDISMVNGDTVSIQICDPFIIESKITSNTFYALHDNHWKVDCAYRKQGHSTADIIRGNVEFYLHKDLVSELQFWFPKGYHSPNQSTSYGYDSSNSELYQFLSKELLANQWKPLARSLNITDSEIDRIKHCNPDDLTEQIYQMFRLWERKSGLRGGALIKSLFTALEYEELNDLAQKGRTILKK